MDVVSWLLARKYVDKSLIGIGALKGAPCKVKSVVKTDGMTTVTLSWKDDLGVSHDTEFYVKDGVTRWEANTNYAVGDLVIYDDILYYCEVANHDATFIPSNWTMVSGAGDTDYFIVEHLSDLPNNLTSTDRKIYFVIQDKSFHLWDGTSWSIITADVKIRELTQAQYDALPTSEKMNGTIYFVTDTLGGGAIYLNGIRYASGGGSSNYSELINKPTINGVTLAEGQTPNDLGLVNNDTTYMDSNGAVAVGVITNAQIAALFN